MLLEGGGEHKKPALAPVDGIGVDLVGRLILSACDISHDNYV